MNRAATVLALLIAAPSLASAQGIMTTEAVFGPRVRITPYVGQAPTVGRTERWAVDNGAVVSYGEFDVDLGSGPAVGLAVEAAVTHRFAAMFSGNYINRGQTREYSISDGVFLASEGANFLTAKVAAGLRLWEPESEMQLRRLTATIYAGPAWVYEMPSDQPGIDPAFSESLSHWAANLGVDANIPLGRSGMAIQLGLEDYYTFWNAVGIAERNDNAVAGSGFTSLSAAEIDNSHMILVRAGLSFRFQ